MSYYLNVHQCDQKHDMIYSCKHLTKVFAIAKDRLYRTNKPFRVMSYSFSRKKGYYRLRMVYKTKHEYFHGI